MCPEPAVLYKGLPSRETYLTRAEMTKVFTRDYSTWRKATTQLQLPPASLSYLKRENKTEK